MADLSPDTRDTSVQVLDKFLSLSLEENSSSMSDAEFISLASASSIILSSKIHDTPPLRMVRYVVSNCMYTRYTHI